MAESYTTLPTSHLLGSVPAVVVEDERNTNTIDYVGMRLSVLFPPPDLNFANSSYFCVNDNVFYWDFIGVAPAANLLNFPPNTGGSRGNGYQNIGSTSAGGGQPSTNWQGVFSISSYTQYFNVDTDIVLNRLLSSLNPVKGDFFSKIDANPDLYGLIWISTTLVFVIAALGNCATYFMDKISDSSTSWSFNVNYLSEAACLVYGYALAVPLGFYFLVQYLGSNASVIRFWCLWGYSLFILVLTSVLLLIPVEILRWLIILIAGGASACFVSLNLKSYLEGSDLSVIVITAFILQLGFAVLMKILFFG
ncbi:YIPF1-like protein [Drosera capensis]